MEIAIIILLIVLLLFLMWDRIQARQRLKEQGDALSKTVGERIDGTVQVFGDLRDRGWESWLICYQPTTTHCNTASAMAKP